MANDGYNTKQRELVLQCIKDCAGHITALEIVRKLDDEGTPVGIATVYRQLDKLVKSNIIRKFTSLDGESACYQIISELHRCDEHFHLKCTGCGDLIHMDCDFMDEMDEHIKSHHGFTVDSSKTVLYGCCKKCSPDSKEKKDV